MEPYIHKKIQFFIFLVLIIGIIIIFFAYPQLIFEGATKGMDTWIKVVIPALFPFFVAAEIMITMGIVDFVSVLLSPIMEPLFGCSGSSSFVWAMSITSGYPTCAHLVTSLIKQKNINTLEGQKILAFASTSGPLFMLGAVGIGMLDSPGAGRIIAFSHYFSALIIGFLFKYYGKNSCQKKNISNKDIPTLHKAMESMYVARKKNTRNLGQIIRDSIKNSFETLVIVGGFLIIFSALTPLVIKIFPANHDFLNGLISGMLEMTTGCMTISQSSMPLPEKIACISFIIGWSGLSVHCQVISMISETSISISIYVVTKLLHGILSAIIGLTISNILYIDYIQTFNPMPTVKTLSWTSITQYSLKFLSLTLFILLVLGMFVILLHKLHKKYNER